MAEGEASQGGAGSAEHPAPRHLILHLSDTHFTGTGRLYGGVDSEARLTQLLRETVASGVRPEAMVFTGDLADRGEASAYERLRCLVEPVAQELGAQLIWVMGNHDERARLRRTLLGERPEETPLDEVHWLGGLRIIVLDTSVPGHHYGELTARQLDWLAAELTRPAAEGTLLAMHHPPMPMIQNLAILTELRRQDLLGEVVRGTDVRLILAGHLHFSSSAMFAGIPVSVASATCYTQDLNVQVGASRGHDGGQAFNLVHVYPDTIVNSVASLGTFATVGEYVSAEETHRRLRAAGAPAGRRAARR